MNAETMSLILSLPAPGINEEFSRVLQRLLSLTSAWVKGQKARVSDGYLVTEQDGLMLYAIGREQTYDFDLGRELSEFSILLADQGLDLNTTLLPASSPEELAAFFDPSRGPAIRIPAE